MPTGPGIATTASGKLFGALNNPANFAIQLPALSATLPFLLLIMVTLRLPLMNPSPVFALALVFVVLLLGMAKIFSLDLLSVVALGATLALEYAWHSARFSADHAMLPLAWYIGFAAVFTIFPFLFHRQFAAKTVPWATAALAAPLHFFLVYDVMRTAYPNGMPGLIPAAFSVPSLLGLIVLLKRTSAQSPARNAQLALFGGAALFFITLIFPIQFDRQWITLGWALEGVALCWLFQRVPHPGLRLVGAALLAVAFVRLALNPAVLSYHTRSVTPIFNWYLYTYGIVTICLFAAARLLAPPRNLVLGRNAQPLFYALGTILAFLLLNIEIADYFSRPGMAALTFQFSGNFARDMSYSIAWAAFALLLLIIGIRQTARPVRYASLGLLGVTILKLFLHDLSQLDQLYRIAAFVVVAIIAIFASFLYQRFLGLSAKADPMKFGFAGFLIAAFLHAALLGAMTPNEWRFSQAIDVPATGLVRVNVPAETLDAARPDLADVRIADGAGREVPYLIDRPMPRRESALRSRELRTELEPTATRITLTTGTKFVLRGVTFETPPGVEFIKAVGVEGSHDGATWLQLATDKPIFRMAGGAANPSVSFSEGVWEFLRLTIDDSRTAAVPFTGVLLQLAEATAPAEPFPHHNQRRVTKVPV